MQVTKQTVIRTAVLFLALINSVLIMFGKNPLPFADEEIYGGLSAVFTAAAALWSWWRNNSFTTPALMADEYLKELKAANSPDKKQTVYEEEQEQ